MTENEKPDAPLPAKRPYTMSDEALAQRRTNQPKASAAGALCATGPTSDEGKAAVSRNGWKHGRYSAINRAHFGVGATSIAKLFGKPCVTTCPYHPDNAERTEAPCSLVLDGLTHAGGSCLDKTVYVRALDSLMMAMGDGDMDGMHGVLANELASTLQIVAQVREELATKGIMVAVYERDQKGNLLLDADGEPLVCDMKLNPALMALAKFNDSLGINFAELMATPKARQSIEDTDNAVDGMQRLVGAIFGRAGAKLKKPGRTIEHNDDEGMT